MKKLNEFLTNLANIYMIHVIVPVRQALFKLRVKLLPMSMMEDADDIEDELAWKKKEQDFQQYMKKKHFFFYLFGKCEGLIMWVGFFAFILDPILKAILDSFDGGIILHTLLRGVEGGAMGLGFASWMRSKSQEKTIFMITRWTTKFFDKIGEALHEHEENTMKDKPKRAD